jgi:Family of unknown function (DUF6459)
MPPHTLSPRSSATARHPEPEPFDLSRLQLVKVPGIAPPYDDEARDAADGPTSGPTPNGQTASGPTPNGPTELAPRTGPRPTASSPAAAGVTAAWPRHFAHVIVEVLGGSRPPRQLAGWTTDRVRARIVALVPAFGTDQRPRIQRVLASWPANDVVEATVVVSFGPRTRALAVRFERRAGRPAAPGLPARPPRWLCTEIEAG